MSTILLHWRYQLEVRATKKNLCILTPPSWNHGWRKLHVFICQLSADPCGPLIQLLVLRRLECEWLSAASKLRRLHSCSLCFWLFVKKISINCCPLNSEQVIPFYGPLQWGSWSSQKLSGSRTKDTSKASSGGAGTQKWACVFAFSRIRTAFKMAGCLSSNDYNLFDLIHY